MVWGEGGVEGTRSVPMARAGLRCHNAFTLVYPVLSALIPRFECCAQHHSCHGVGFVSPPLRAWMRVYAAERIERRGELTERGRNDGLSVAGHSYQGVVGGFGSRVDPIFIESLPAGYWVAVMRAPPAVDHDPAG